MEHGDGGALGGAWFLVVWFVDDLDGSCDGAALGVEPGEVEECGEGDGGDGGCGQEECKC